MSGVHGLRMKTLNLSKVSKSFLGYSKTKMTLGDVIALLIGLVLGAIFSITVMTLVKP
jgi:hypothetical protein